jgi:hypothetical protein
MKIKQDYKCRDNSMTELQSLLLIAAIFAATLAIFFA